MFDFVSILQNSFISGTDTVSTFLEWFTLYMVAFPEVQEKLYAEVCSVIGERSATLEDRSATHFAEATILEVMRHCPHLALTVPHYTSGEIRMRRRGFAISLCFTVCNCQRALLRI